MAPESPSPRNERAPTAPGRVGHIGRPHDRWVAPGGWQRAVYGTGAGVIAGLLLAAAARGDRRRADSCGTER